VVVGASVGAAVGTAVGTGVGLAVSQRYWLMLLSWTPSEASSVAPCVQSLLPPLSISYEMYGPDKKPQGVVVLSSS
jgi:hypothetical protein